MAFQSAGVLPFIYVIYLLNLTVLKNALDLQRDSETIADIHLVLVLRKKAD